ncbi:MAG: hypothetical protein JNK79_11415 [Chitinophagaceae bacterium]|nr:hypothetical protein [Chitinophagaceae bacterium]
MKPLLPLVVLTLLAFNNLTAQIIRPFSLRYSNPSVRGNIVFVANNVITSNGITTEAPPAGTTSNNNGPGINVDVDALIFNYGSTWKYLDNNTRPANWNQTTFNDASWSSGAGQFGYGDGDETTIVSYGPNAASKYITTYFRKAVNIPNPGLYSSFIINVNYDDGFVLYINGVEVNRTNMPTGTIAHGTVASGAVESMVSLTIPTSAFVAGNNVIAIEMHQNQANSSDLSMDMSLGYNDGITVNSSTADLNLPSCSQVVWAGLYWGAGQGASGSNTAWITGETQCKIKVPGAGSYTTITSTQTDYHNNTLIPGYVHTGFKCFADITALINTSSANGTYTVGNITSPAGITDAYGGWTIVVAYTNATEQIRNLTVYDGNAGVRSGSGNVDVNISGFLTPPTGPVTCELGAVVYDGDRNSADAFSFQQGGAGPFYDLTATGVSNAADMWNSTISYKGTVVTTRNPAHQNTLGYDADIISVPNASNAQLGNSQTNAVVRFSSPNENYLVHVLSMSVSQFNPSMKLVKSAIDANGGSLVGNDVLLYRLDYKNVGADGATGAIITDNIPAGSTYKAGSLTINGFVKSDASGDDQAEFDFTNNRVVFRVGTGANSSTGGALTATNSATDSGYVEFEVYVTSSCSLSGCTNTLSNSARMDYVGSTSHANLSDSSGVLSAGCFTLGPLVSPIAGSCFVPNDTILVNTCPTASVTLPVMRYIGYSFYSAMPFTSGNLYNPATPVTTTRTLYAYGTNGSCIDTVIIRVNISACPDIDNDKDGIPDYVESNLSAALGDHDSDGIRNYLDTNYPGYVDNNGDGINDNFDPGADSDNDGIPNFLDTNFPGFVDTDSDGVNDNFDTDLDGIPDYLDIDSDNDGIPDNIEAQTTATYTFASGSDSDGDGLDNTYDNFVGVGGNGINPVDTDGDLIPDYRDTDSDADGYPDILEGNDLNFNNTADDNVVLTGVDTDGDGLDDFFDLNNSSIEGTSQYMGTNGSITGDLTPGSRTVVQRTSNSSCPTERDWRCGAFLLACSDITLKGKINGGEASLDWFTLCDQKINNFLLERSIDGSNFMNVAVVKGSDDGHAIYHANDNVSKLSVDRIYYRVISVVADGKKYFSPVVALNTNIKPESTVKLISNPVANMIELDILAYENSDVEVTLFGSAGNKLMTRKEKVRKGDAKLKYAFPAGSSTGIYYLHVRLNKSLKVIKVQKK